MKNALIERTALRYGILTAGTLVAFFFLMLAAGLIQVYELRILNILFLFAGVYMAINSYRSNPASRSNYLVGIGVGLLTSGITLLLFSTFVIVFLSSNPSFMETLKSHEYFGRYLNPYIAGVVIFLEGTISGLLVSFILMQYYKRSHLEAVEPSIP